MQAEYWGLAIFGRVVGIQQGLASIPSIIAPFAIGWLYDQTGSYLVGFMIVAAVLSISLPLTLTMTRPKSATADGVRLATT